MKYIKKIPSADRELSSNLLSAGWKRLKEPKNLTITILLSIPFMIINGIISVGIIYYLYKPLSAFLKNNNGLYLSINLIFLLIYILVFFIFMTIHEFIHALFIPNVFKSNETYWGINGFVGFVYTTEQIKKSRYLIISFMPFFLLSIILPFILNALGWLNGFTIFLCFINAMGSCVDCFNMVLITIQVPKGSYIINNGFETYYK